MLIRNVTKHDLEQALARINLQYVGNIVFKRCDADGKTRQGGEKFIVTLTVKNSRAPGSRKSPTGRRIAAACWHAHGHFMDALPADTEIVTSGPKGKVKKHPGDPWQDWCVGPYSGPIQLSTLCDCRQPAR